MTEAIELNNVAMFVPPKSDEQLAIELRAAMSPLLDEACKILDKAVAAGMTMNWVINKDSFGRRHRVIEISVVKNL
jgi:hypothetical protein